MRLAQTLSCDYHNLALMTLQSISPSSPILRQTPCIKVDYENVYFFVQDPCYNKIEDTTLCIPESIVDDPKPCGLSTTISEERTEQPNDSTPKTCRKESFMPPLVKNVFIL